VDFLPPRASGDGPVDDLPSSRITVAPTGDRGIDPARPANPTPLMSNPTWTAEGDQEKAYFGGSVPTEGNVNGDGIRSHSEEAPQGGAQAPPRGGLSDTCHPP